MSSIKKLGSQTIVYGLPTIVGRALNFLLNPLYAYSFTPLAMGVVATGYAYSSFLIVLLTYGMETALFRFSHSDDKDKVYTTALISVFASSVLFITVATIFSVPISDYINFTNHPEYVTWFAIIVSSDAFAAVIFAKLREKLDAKRFAKIKLLNMTINIGLNLFFILFCKRVYEMPESVFKPFVNLVYNPSIGVGYIFICLLVSSLTTVLILSPEVFKFSLRFDVQLWKKMMRYSFPLLIGGVAGIANDNLDKMLLPYLLPKGTGMAETGIYSSCYKVSIIMNIFIQAFRFSVEPFFFNHFKEEKPQKMYADVMKYFVIICSIIFLGTMMNIGWIQYFAGSEEFRTGIKIVPILLVANMCFGIFYNQSIWYKLTGQTQYGAYIGVFGAIITTALNLYWIPIIGYMGSAWATLVCYASMMVVSYFLGNKYYPVDYDLKKIFGYIFLAIGLYLFSLVIATGSFVIDILMNNLLMLGFILLAWKLERKHFAEFS